DDTHVQFLLGIAHGKVGWTLEHLGGHDAAREQYEQGLAIHRRLQELDPANADWRREVAVGHRRLCAVLARRDPIAALRHLRLAVDALSRLHLADPSNSERRLDFALARLDLGRGLLAAGDPDRAATEERTALETLTTGAAGAEDRSR